MNKFMNEPYNHLNTLRFLLHQRVGGVNGLKKKFPGLTLSTIRSRLEQIKKNPSNNTEQNVKNLMSTLRFANKMSIAGILPRNRLVFTNMLKSLNTLPDVAVALKRKKKKNPLLGVQKTTRFKK
jgi:hypothetical protein